MANNIPSRNPSYDNTLQGLFKLAFTKFFTRIDGVLPAIVQSYTPGSPAKVSVLPAIQSITTNDELVSKAVIASIPVLRLGNSSYSIEFPLQKGDLGLLIANDRDISAFVRSGQDSAPQTNRVKNFSDAFFFPMPLKGHTSASDGFSIQKNDQSVQILLESNSLTLKAASHTIVIDGSKITINGMVEINGDDVEINCSNRVLINGDLAVSGNITAGGNITPNTPP